MKTPARPVDTGPGSGAVNTSFFFTQYVMKNHQADNTRLHDPREALLKLDSLAKAEPTYIGRAYSQTQPQPVLMTMTLEQEQDEFKKRQKKVLG